MNERKLSLNQSAAPLHYDFIFNDFVQTPKFVDVNNFGSHPLSLVM